jgi:peptide/nickel transport system substrate-binding protein
MHHPKHYLSKWHIKYNPKADEVARAEGFDAWWKAFNLHAAIFEAQQDPNLPSVNPWVMTRMNTEGDKIYLRNPYFWKVDTAGNQLPYIDEVHRVVVKTTEIMDLKTMSGELNVGGAKLSFQDYPVYKEGEQKGNYRAILMSGDVRANQGMSFNLWHKDPVMRAIFNDLRFRQALSVAMNRPKLNEVLYLGKGKPWQATTAPSCTFFEDWVGTYYTEYDPTKAAALLDEMGLKWDKDHKYRLRPDGQTLALNIQFVDLGSSWKERLELKAKDWEAIGIKVAVKEIERSLYLTLQSAAELDFAIWNYEAQESDLQYSKSYFLHGVYWNNPWSLWHQTKGKQGSEPPAEIRRYFEKMEQWAVQLPGSPEYIRLGKEVLGENVKMLWSIGDLIDGPQPAVFAKNLANTPDAGPLIWPGQRFWKLFRPDQWFFR